ncbi:LLM class flavin-dependent oxidoreductase [Kineococcus aurantiacus]|uniref:Alkanesulfonate monooxygenase SsuD/methylene tetrahydromethanopterin reductase-like flavin-dependent oxidoreductase (Luciferase family) n=1 Tax=Kineococcus aurantiacus TaxID=37633 RepID=A0A7Y9DN00_9ACTN|nr:LLM class flavin-dependent oxidoreductase [Kineococcus aurantiacus]NYD23613.1 alkanesulfonate monooxygenase SsuD/methylene tetrahydromethanopterin reductase-like flavin-dependent oxidoreductase (luciferase family) [Kineococcus aurantiacus]
MSTGVTVPRDLPAADLLPFARRAEALGFSSLWVIEDLGFRGGFAQAAAALAVTERIGVGLGIAPAAARNPVFTAMEASTLAEQFPGRFTLGLGHGVPTWMRQVGAWSRSPLTSLSEHLDAVRRLLHGETVTVDGDRVHLDGVRLEFAPEVPPAVVAGVRGPKSLALSGRVADGTLLAEPVTPEYARAAREQIGAGPGHRLTGYELAVVDDDPAAARAAVRPGLLWVGTPDAAVHTATSPYAEELLALRASCADADEFTRRMPDAWVDDLTLAGTPDRVRSRIAELRAAGLDEVVLFPVGDPLRSIDSLARALP